MLKPQAGYEANQNSPFGFTDTGIPFLTDGPELLIGVPMRRVAKKYLAIQDPKTRLPLPGSIGQYFDTDDRLALDEAAQIKGAKLWFLKSGQSWASCVELNGRIVAKAISDFEKRVEAGVEAAINEQRMQKEVREAQLASVDGGREYAS